MKNSSKLIKILSNVQIVSALIWAAVILLCSYFSKDNNISTILITAAGFHVVLLSNFFNKKNRSEEKGNIKRECV